MIGYKAFDKNLCCRGFHFEVGRTYETGVPADEMKLCTNTVFHYCRELFEIERVSLYKLSESRICEVIAGAFVQEGEKYGTNELTILREIVGEEKLNLINSGNSNNGIRNSGYWNSGNWNSGYWNSGYFNTDEPTVRMFNKDTGLKVQDIKFPSFLFNIKLTKWVYEKNATVSEKQKYAVEIKTQGGFLKTLDYKEAFQKAWNEASEEEHQLVKNLPNFDADIFYKISGIRVKEK